MNEALKSRIGIIEKRTKEMDQAERAGDMKQYDRLMSSRGAAVLEALEMGASPAYLREITGN